MAHLSSSERIPVTIVCGPKKHDIFVESSKPNGLPIVNDLQCAAEEACGIPAIRQRVIFKGKTLREPGAMLCDVGIEPQSRVMIVGQRFDPGQDATCSAIQKTVNACGEAEKKLHSVRDEVEGIVGGHLPVHLHAQAITKLIRITGGVGEELVRLLESLDALTLQQDQTEARSRRKAAVRQIQSTLDRVDSLSSQLADLKKEKVS